MNQSDDTRRRVIKTLVLAGFGLHLVGCSSPEDPKKKPKTPPITDADTTNIDVIEKEVTSNNVTYFTTENEEFEDLATYFNLHTQKTPAIIALVVNAEGASEAIKYAKEQNLPVSIKSGGHSFEQFSSNNGGLVINLSLLNQMEWGSNNELIAGSACLLRDIYDFVLPEGRLLAAGSCGTVGLGG
ncbi:MAG: FAD-binding protein, partial [Crocinitomicaceae bacterium]|nr:FAD-binding protein [Crocinitomicaceae bacterium]